MNRIFTFILYWRIIVIRTAALSLCFALSVPAIAYSGPTPIPGGANQVKAVSGTLGHMLWNGKLRLKIDTVREETPAESADGGLTADQKMILIEGTVRNGMAESITVRPDYKLADKGDITEANSGPPTGYQTLTLAQGAAGRLKYRMPVPKDFVPVKLLVDPSRLLGGPFRISLVPAAAQPS
ncbi:MAG: hypothetical protein NVSMB64_19580 [Candidatus Velthaea sp.]